MERILGVDPGIGITGFCILDTNYRQTKLHAYGTIRPKTKDSTPKRLQYLFDEMNIILKNFLPSVLAIEDAFYSKNIKSAMTLGHARGALILSATKSGLKIHEFAPRKVKMSVTGNGAASKEQISYMVSKILNLDQIPKPMDISDAIAVGLCFINQNKYL
tara:strand:- start:1079 stop:1558 length:480 start_codon:yes stop_codon:yes gene_type:complete